MKKSLRNLAQVAAGLGAAYALTKMGKSPEEKGLDIARSETRDMTSDEAIAPRKAARISDAQRMSNQAAQEDASRAAFAQANKARDTFASDSPISLNPKTGMYGEPGSVEGFKAAEQARKAEIFGNRNIDPNSPRAKLAARLNRAKKGKMIKAAHGGAVVARGNKLARSKPTKLF